MSLVNRPLPRWLGPVLLAIVAVDVVVSVTTHRTLSPTLVGLAIGVTTLIAVDFIGSAGKRRLQASVQPARVFTVALDRTTAARLTGLGEGSLLHERALLVADPAALEIWTEESVPKRVLVIPWQRLAGATVESHDAGKLHTISLEIPGAEPLILDVVRPVHERVRRRAATAAEVAAGLEARVLPAKVG